MNVVDTVADLLATYKTREVGFQLAGQTIQSADHQITPAFGGFVTRNDGFAADLGSLRESVLAYAERSRAARPLNLLLAAEPGAGKSYLIKQLARSMPDHVGAQFDEFYTVALRDRDDLTAVFHRVQSANLNRKLPFVFLDEIDGRVQDRHILADLLAPMWDGVFHSGRDSFALGKAVLVFAGSSLIPPPTIKAVFKSKPPSKLTYERFCKAWTSVVDNAVSKGLKIDKAADFLDRIDIRVCIPPTSEALLGAEGARLETIDIVCMMTRKHFPSIDFIEHAVIEALIDSISKKRSRRYAESIIFRSTPQAELQGKALCLRDLPEPDRSIYLGNPKLRRFQGSFLRIVTP